MITPSVGDEPKNLATQIAESKRKEFDAELSRVWDLVVKAMNDSPIGSEAINFGARQYDARVIKKTIERLREQGFHVEEQRQHQMDYDLYISWANAANY